MPADRFYAWSYSRLSDYEACPLRAKLKHLVKLPDPGNAAMARGADVHGSIAKYLSKKTRVPPPEAKLFRKELGALRILAPKVEEQWGFDGIWKPTDWFGLTTVARLVLDAYVLNDSSNRFPPTLTIVDFKTGKKRDGYTDQLELYALGGFAKFPKVSGVTVELWYLDMGPKETERATYGRSSEFEALKLKWAKRVKPMLSDRRFPPTPGNACRWCPYSASKGGPCQF